MISKNWIILLFCVITIYPINLVHAEVMNSSNYQLHLYESETGFDTSTDTVMIGSSVNFRLGGDFEDFDTAFTTGGNYRIKSGFQPTYEANVPEISVASTNDNGVILFDRAIIEVDPNNNPTSANGAWFALQISKNSSFPQSETYYINRITDSIDYTSNQNFLNYSNYYDTCAQTNSPNDLDCGTITGHKYYIKGLEPNTTYYIRAIAMNGDLTNSEPGPYATFTTGNLYLTLTLSTQNINLIGINTYSTTLSNYVDVSIETNNQYGYNLYIQSQGDNTNAGLYSSSKNFLIPSNYSGNLDSVIGTNRYGIGATKISGPGTIANTYDETLTGRNSTYVGQLNTTPTLFCSYNNPHSNGNPDVIRTRAKGNVDLTTPSSNDYNDILTFTALAI